MRADETYEEWFHTKDTSHWDLGSAEQSRQQSRTEGRAERTAESRNMENPNYLKSVVIWMIKFIHYLIIHQAFASIIDAFVVEPFLQ